MILRRLSLVGVYKGSDLYMPTGYNGEFSVHFWEEYIRMYSENGQSFSTPAIRYRNTWLDYNLIPEKPPYIALPEVNYSIVSIPNSSDRIDITEFMPGGQTYGNRKGSWKFYIDHDRWASWAIQKDLLSEFLHGKRLVVRLDDSEEFYIGRFRISDYKSEKDYSTCTIEYDLDCDSLEDIQHYTISDNRSLDRDDIRIKYRPISVIEYTELSSTDYTIRYKPLNWKFSR